nr:uncharacterized protein LOC129443124 [Misgurnus anguillicaudatus]XP_055059515.1 uncharacterized protein LOC129443124 [Misgurnus anguillicaudatus]XP_055059516.1 uncharacterized protein LOC129443124 [Misgurnus anguillicaudatus]XP_055059517.1 uncharacterized protein LOC129443124 [Misgurnus anguillicaudatus]XP_055059518.1 uncharacterized protein LOC129443124 [Misgurnus anguillicaudatus]XP_055059519.1 uncharacterized protein LOC129443124 [Misgurnus anguillicaudatus]XP_055059520.1 uncharacterize
MAQLKADSVSTQSWVDRLGLARVRGRNRLRIPCSTLRFVTATGAEQFLCGPVLFEPSESGLPAGLLITPSLVQVSRGTALVPVVNVGTTDVWSYPRTPLGTLTGVHVVSLPAGVSDVSPVVATVSSQAVSCREEQIGSIDLPGLPVEEQDQVRALLWRSQSVFSSHEGDLGCTDLLSRDILLLDDSNKIKRVHRSLLKPRLRAGPIVVPLDRPVVEQEQDWADSGDEVDLWAVRPDIPIVAHSRGRVGDPNPLEPVSGPLSDIRVMWMSVYLLRQTSCLGWRLRPPLEVSGPSAALQRPRQVTAGQHSNLYHLPRSVGREAPSVDVMSHVA